MTNSAEAICFLIFHRGPRREGLREGHRPHFWPKDQQKAGECSLLRSPGPSVAVSLLTASRAVFALALSLVHILIKMSFPSSCACADYILLPSTASRVARCATRVLVFALIRRAALSRALDLLTSRRNGRPNRPPSQSDEPRVSQSQSFLGSPGPSGVRLRRSSLRSCWQALSPTLSLVARPGATRLRSASSSRGTCGR